MSKKIKIILAIIAFSIVVMSFFSGVIVGCSSANSKRPKFYLDTSKILNELSMTNYTVEEVEVDRATAAIATGSSVCDASKGNVIILASVNGELEFNASKMLCTKYNGVTSWYPDGWCGVNALSVLSGRALTHSTMNELFNSGIVKRDGYVMNWKRLFSYYNLQTAPILLLKVLNKKGFCHFCFYDFKNNAISGNGVGLADIKNKGPFSVFFLYPPGEYSKKGLIVSDLTDIS